MVRGKAVSSVALASLEVVIGRPAGADASEAAAAPADAADGEGELDVDDPRTLTMAGFGPR